VDVGPQIGVRDPVEQLEAALGPGATVIELAGDERHDPA
jgi:hypothetical protein